MPPVVRFTHDTVLNAAYELVRRDGPGALNARAVAKELGGSTQPIFRLFSGMDELHLEVIRLADEQFCQRMLERCNHSAKPYISICVGYLLFARDEPQLFRLLFMRDRVTNSSTLREYKHEWGFPMIEKSFGVDRKTAIRIYERTFFFTHGLAVVIATKFMPCMSEEKMEALVTESVLATITQMGVPFTVN